MISEQMLLERLRGGEVRLPPLSIDFVEANGRGEPGRIVDAVIEVEWVGRRYRFVVECRPRSTPKVFQEAITTITRAASPPETFPLLLMPYLSTDQLRELEKNEVSGIDLCGNGLVVVPGRLLVFRTGQPNQFPQSYPIKNVYRGTSSLVARVLLARPRYSAVNDIQTEILSRKGRVSISTISKVIKRLEEELIVSRSADGIRLLDPDELLGKLVENDAAPTIRERFVGKCSLDTDALMRTLVDVSARRSLRLALTGACSTECYAVMPREGKRSFYCSRRDELVGALAGRIEQTERFADLELLETDDNRVYFDTRVQQPYPWAPPLQTYLELMRGDKRDRQTAEQVKTVILDEISRFEAGLDG